MIAGAVPLSIMVSIGFLVSWLLTRSLSSPRSLFYHLDHPNERSLHRTPTPRWGGLGIWVGILSGLLGYGIVEKMIVPGGEMGGIFSMGGDQDLFWILGLASLLVVSSFLDDRFGLPAVLRFGIHVAAAVTAVWVMSPSFDLILIPVIGDIPLGVFGTSVAVLFVVWITNLYNFMDGMDGFAAGMTVIGFSFLSVVCFIKGVNFTGVFSLCVVSVAAGFLSFNFPPARIFMGDIGSIPLGFLLGTLSLKGAMNNLFDFWVPIMIFSPFIVDASVTLIRRLFRGEVIWQAHRSHYYQRLVLAGWGHRKTVLAEYGLMVFCGGAALVFHQTGPATRLAILVGLALVYVLIMVWISRFEQAREMSLTDK